MTTKEIPRERWNRFFDDFSRNHTGWIVSLEVLGSSFGAQPQASGLPLVGITVDLTQGASRIEVRFGDQAESPVTRIIESPKRVCLEESATKDEETIEVESDDGTMTRLLFRNVEPVVLPLPDPILATAPAPA